MSNYLTHIAARALGGSDVVKPRPASLFEPDSIIGWQPDIPVSTELDGMPGTGPTDADFTSNRVTSTDSVQADTAWRSADIPLIDQEVPHQIASIGEDKPVIRRKRQANSYPMSPDLLTMPDQIQGQAIHPESTGNQDLSVQPNHYGRSVQSPNAAPDLPQTAKRSPRKSIAYPKQEKASEARTASLQPVTEAGLTTPSHLPGMQQAESPLTKLVSKPTALIQEIEVAGERPVPITREEPIPVPVARDPGAGVIKTPTASVPTPQPNAGHIFSKAEPAMLPQPEIPLMELETVRKESSTQAATPVTPPSTAHAAARPAIPGAATSATQRKPLEKLSAASAMMPIKTIAGQAPLREPPKVPPLLKAYPEVKIAPAFEPPDAPPAPTIQVTIGRIEIRATPQTAPAKPRERTPPPVMSLDDYLKQRRGGR